MARDPNLEMLRRVAARLGELRNQVVFVGGATVGSLISDQAGPTIRHTDDVDVIVEVVTHGDYENRIAPALRKLNFQNVIAEDVPICRWQIDDILVDVMPTDTSVLGFSNRWYRGAMSTAWPLDVGDATIQVITPPYFLATKLEAFHGRGDGDYPASHDLEDIIAVIDGRHEIVRDVRDSDSDVRRYLADQCRDLLRSRSFRDSIPGHLAGDAKREPIVLRRLRFIAWTEHGLAEAKSRLPQYVASRSDAQYGETLSALLDWAEIGEARVSRDDIAELRDVIDPWGPEDSETDLLLDWLIERCSS